MPRPRVKTPTYTLILQGGVYYVRWWQDGAATRKSCGTKDKAEAEVFRDSLISELATPIRPDVITIGAVLDGYAADRDGEVHSSAITYAVKNLKRHLSSVPVDSFTRERCKIYLEARRKEGSQAASAKYRKKAPTLSDGTLRRELGVLRTALRWAEKGNWITSVPSFDLPPSQPGRKRWLTKQEAARLFSACETLHVKTFLALALYTAGRMSAILELTWDRVDEENGLIMLSDGITRGKKRRQTVPIPEGLKPYLAEARTVATTKYVIEWRGEPVASVKVGVRNSVEKAGLRDVTPHVMRHTAATWMIKAGLPLKAVAEYLGDTEAMIEKHYGHFKPEWLREAGEAISM